MMETALYSALNAVKVLRSSVGQVFDTLGNGLRADHGEDGKDTKFLFELQELLSTVNINLRYCHSTMFSGDLVSFLVVRNLVNVLVFAISPVDLDYIIRKCVIVSKCDKQGSLVLNVKWQFWRRVKQHGG